mgnify:FL=1
MPGGMHMSTGSCAGLRVCRQQAIAQPYAPFVGALYPGKHPNKPHSVSCPQPCQLQLSPTPMLFALPPTVNIVVETSRAVV